MALRRMSEGKRRREGHVAIGSTGEAGSGDGIRELKRTSDSDADGDEEWQSENSSAIDAETTDLGAAGGARRRDSQLDYELAHVAIDTIALYRLKCKRSAEKMKRLQAELQHERQRSEAARERYEALSSRSGQQRYDGGAARGDQQKAADGRRSTASRDSKMGTRVSPGGRQPQSQPQSQAQPQERPHTIPGDKELQRQLLTQLEQLDERLSEMETQNEKSRDMLEQARLENQSLMSRARCAQIESQRLVRLQMASDRANEELKRRFAREKREHDRLYTMAEKHKAPDERQFDPDAAGEQRDGLRGSQEAYPESNTNIWMQREGSVASRARSGRSAAPPQTSETRSQGMRSQGMRPRETATARSDPDTAVRHYAPEARSERESKR